MNNERDSLGDRMKRQYEDRIRYLLPRRTYTILRLDGRSFHTLTRGADKPFDVRIRDAMTVAAHAVLQDAQGAKLAYLQSDEISILLTDFDTITTEAWFDGNVQKITSVSAALASVAFTLEYRQTAEFDARVFTIPDPVEVVNYFVWRQKDAERNSVQMCAQAKFSPKQLHGLSCEALKEMLRDLSYATNTSYAWEDREVWERRGWALRRHVLDATGRSSWLPDYEMPIITEFREYVTSLLPDAVYP